VTPGAAPAPWSLLGGISVDGQLIWIPLRDRGGIVVGGRPGSGKTAGLRTIVSPLMRSRHTQMAYIDGKGGGDWDGTIAERCFASVSVVDDPEPAVNLLRSLDAERKRRATVLPKLRGSSNFWSGGPGPELPLIVLVIDEAQAILDSSYHAKSDKAAQGLVAEAQGLCKRLSALGRSAGLLTVVATQKPTSESIPSMVRDNATAAICFSVATRQAAEAVLGDKPDKAFADDADPPSPIGLPQGVAVVAMPGESLVKVRVPYIPEAVLRETARETAHLMTDPRRGLLHDA
jgi:DNA segregation ATPase FtsK/SpoIIIE-like protein